MCDTVVPSHQMQVENGPWWSSLSLVSRPKSSRFFGERQMMVEELCRYVSAWPGPWTTSVDIKLCRNGSTFCVIYMTVHIYVFIANAIVKLGITRVTVFEWGSLYAVPRCYRVLRYDGPDPKGSTGCWLSFFLIALFFLSKVCCLRVASLFGINEKR